ncbi:MAG: aspartate aminotransferase [Myxococcales bacterium]|nr:aspartate aminotransferase [Myxococcales bacterium]
MSINHQSIINNEKNDLQLNQSRVPDLPARLGKVGRSVYSQLLHRLANYNGEIYPLHVGDTYLPPAVSMSMIDQVENTAWRAHRYTQVRGHQALTQRVVEWLSERQGMPVQEDEVLITGGGTAGLSALVGALLMPDDELLLLAPYWPLMAGATRLHGAKPVAVPFFQESLTIAQGIERLNQALSPKTKALYINTPNNPTGEVLDKKWLSALVDWASEKGLWVISDEVYDLFCYEGEHQYTRPLDPKRVISAFSMSKAFGMAGYRCAILQGPPEVLSATEKVLTNALYSAATPGQLAAHLALSEQGLNWAKDASVAYQKVGREAAKRLGVPEPQGSTFLFIDVSKEVAKGSTFESEQGGVDRLLEACVDRGLLLAPGSAFGPYPQHLRLCFTAAEPEVVLRGVDILVELLGR